MRSSRTAVMSASGSLSSTGTSSTSQHAICTGGFSNPAFGEKARSISLSYLPDWLIVRSLSRSAMPRATQMAGDVQLNESHQTHANLLQFFMQKECKCYELTLDA